MLNINEMEKNEILEILQKYAPKGQVVAFGSRCKGTNRKFSDLDLAFIKTDKTLLTISETAELRLAFEESELDFRVDIVDYWGTTDNFRKIIDENCVEIYDSEAVSSNVGFNH